MSAEQHQTSGNLPEGGTTDGGVTRDVGGGGSQGTPSNGPAAPGGPKPPGTAAGHVVTGPWDEFRWPPRWFALCSCGVGVRASDRGRVLDMLRREGCLP